MESLKQRIKKLGLSRRFVSEISGVSQSIIINLIAGRGVSEEKILEISDAISKWEWERNTRRMILFKHTGYTQLN